LQKNVAFIKQWLSQNAAFKPDLEDYFEERFAYAGWTGDVEMLKDTDRDDVNRAMQRGRNSMLMHAFVNLHIEFAETVMAIDDAQRSCEREDWIKLLTAVNGDPDTVKLLATSGMLRGFQSILDAAACPANLDTIKTLVEHGTNIVHVVDHSGFTAMHYAARRPKVATLQYLKKLGLDIDAKAGNIEWRPVHEAAAFGHVDVIRWFKRVGAMMITEPGSYGMTLMHVAVDNGRLEVIKYLQENGESLSIRTMGWSPLLHLAAQGGHVGVVRYLVENGADVNALDGSPLDSTPIHLAARGGHVGVVKYLVEKGVDVNDTEVDGSTPIHVATSSNKPEVVRVLRELGANLDLKNWEGLTAFNIAENESFTEIANYLRSPSLPYSSSNRFNLMKETPPTPPPRRSIFSLDRFRR
jgi:ankyrin repeat protein